jgi:hypothetical protein
MSNPIVVGDPGSLSEFVNGYHGTCGETALAVAIAAAQHRKATSQDIVDITKEMQAHSQADANGASTLWDLAREAERKGIVVFAEDDYEADTFPGVNWHQALLDNAGLKPIILQIARGGNLIDIETQAHDEPSVQYHFIAVLGKQTNGYVCADGDNPQAGQRYQIYSFATLTAAMPCAMLILEMGAPKMNLPPGYTDDGETTTAPNGKTISGAIRDQWLTDPARYGDPQEDARQVNPTYREQLFYNALFADNNSQIVIGGAGQRAVQLMGQLTQAQADVDALHAQLASLKSTGGLNPKDVADLAAYRAFKAALQA